MLTSPWPVLPVLEVRQSDEGCDRLLPFLLFGFLWSHLFLLLDLLDGDRGRHDSDRCRFSRILFRLFGFPAPVISPAHYLFHLLKSLAEVSFRVKLKHCAIIEMCAMNYQAVLNWILGFTDYEQLPGSLYSSANFDLRRMEDLLRRLDNPHLASRSIHIAGSKGKGSTAAMIAAALGAAGYKVGLFTSPHLHTMRERISVDGQLISEEELVTLVEWLKPEVEAVNCDANYGQLTTFEVLTALAFLYFREKNVDFQVVEVGLGGRLDATNVVNAEVSIITSISMDHVSILGDTIDKIAREKAGIIKHGGMVVCSPQRPEAMAVIEEVCCEQGARLIKVGKDVTWQKGTADLSAQSFRVMGRQASYELTMPLLGEHQLENAAAAVAALEVLGVDAGDIADGLKAVRWPGRLEILRREPLLVIDGAHNPDSAMRMLDAIKQYFDYRHLILIIGVSSDKDIAGIVECLAPSCYAAFVTRSRHPRSAEPMVLASEFARYGITARVVGSVAESVPQALASAEPGDLVCATGSLFVVAEVREQVKGLSAEVYSL